MTLYVYKKFAVYNFNYLLKKDDGKQKNLYFPGYFDGFGIDICS